MALDYSALVNAVARLAEGLARYRLDTADGQIRDGLIQRFEFTYDLSHKMLRRALEKAAAIPADIDRMSFPTLIRTSAEQGLIAKSLQVTAAIPEFLEELRALVERLQERGGEVTTIAMLP